MPEFYDNTILSTSRTCERKLYFRHIEHLASEGTSPPLAFGSSWGAAMDVIWAAIDADPAAPLAPLVKAAYTAWSDKWISEGMPAPATLSVDAIAELQPRTPGNALEMIANYLLDRRDFIKRYKILGIEQPFAVPLVEEDANLWYCGKFDKLLQERETGGVWVLDHKTTTSYKKDGYFRSEFIEGFSPNTQMDGYAYGARLLFGDRFKGIIIDAALVHKTVHEGFGIIEIKSPKDQMDAWHWETVQEVKRVQAGKAALKDAEVALMQMSYMPAFPRNTRNCFDFFQPCTYIDICQATANPARLFKEKGVPTFLQRRPWSPFDELQLAKLGMEKEGSK